MVSHTVKVCSTSKADLVSAGARHHWSSLGEWQVYLFAFVCLVAGMGLGYLIRGVTVPPTQAPVAASASAQQARGGMGSVPIDQIGAALEETVKRDPKNTALLIQLGNLYSDHRAYLKAIQYYTRALELDPRNANVRTDLGTAYWYADFPQEAITAYKKALFIDPSHVEALFNLGVVYENGLKDYARAISAWEKLLEFHPHSPDRKRVERMIEFARREEAASKGR